jgi:putative transcriptional regulator
MYIPPGTILASSSSMEDPNFHKTIIFITEYNEKGAMGFVVNKIFERSLNELIEFSSSPAFPLYAGGPVDKEHLFFIHRRNDIIPGGSFIIDNVYFGGDFKKAIENINNSTLSSSDIKIFIGYCGWDANELEAEIAEGSWIVTDANSEIPFSKNV